MNVAAIRSNPRTAHLMVLFAGGAVPEEVALAEVDWLAVDGPGPLDSPAKNVTFIARPSTDLLVIRGRESGFSAVEPPGPPHPKELLRVRIRAPSKMLHVPYFAPPADVEALSLVVEARDDGGADIHLREHCPTPAVAAKAAESLEATIARVNRGAGKAITVGILEGAKATTDGNDARVDVTATADQVEALVELALVLLRGP